jgi:hypothetical protein
MLKTYLLVATAIPLFSLTARSQTPPGRSCPANASQILILGTYHMANPGLDSTNLQADDVLSAQRQAEIADVTERLARFAPTKIAVEAPYHEARVPTAYADYRSGKYTLGRNEVEQLGFRLAQHLDLSTVYPVDYPMFMSGLTPSEIENQKPSGEPKPQETTPAKPQKLSREDLLLRNSTVREYLLHVNSSDMIRADQTGYLNMLLPDKTSPAIYGRADLVTNWYKRNLRILANLNRVVDTGKDRVLLIIGSGHLAILRQLVNDSNYYCLVMPEEYLK